MYFIDTYEETVNDYYCVSYNYLKKSKLNDFCKNNSLVGNYE